MKEFITRFKYLVTNLVPDFNYEVKDTIAELVKDEKGEVVGGKSGSLGSSPGPQNLGRVLMC